MSDIDEARGMTIAQRRSARKWATRPRDDSPVAAALATNRGEEPLKGATAVDSNPKEDMHAYDQLGPATRDVLDNHMPIKWSSNETLKMIRAHGKHPIRHDAQIAQQLRGAAEHVARGMASESLTMGDVLEGRLGGIATQLLRGVDKGGSDLLDGFRRALEKVAKRRRR